MAGTVEVGFTLRHRPAIVVVYPHPHNERKLRKRVIPVRDHAEVLRLAPAELAQRLVAATRPILDGADGAQLEALAGRLATEMRKAMTTSAPAPHTGTAAESSTARAPQPVGGVSHAGGEGATRAPGRPDVDTLSRDLLREVAGMLSDESDDGDELSRTPGASAGNIRQLPTCSSLWGDSAGGSVGGTAPGAPAQGRRAAPRLDALDALGGAASAPVAAAPMPRAEPAAATAANGPFKMAARAFAFPDALDSLSTLSTRPAPAAPPKPTAAQLRARSDSVASIDSFGSIEADSPAAASKPVVKPAPKARGGAKVRVDPLAALLGMSDSDSDGDGAAGARGGQMASSARASPSAARGIGASMPATCAGARGGGWNPPGR